MKTIFILFLVLITFSASAQTHNLKKSSCCKFVPGPKNNEGCSPCLACAKEKEVENEARKKEDKLVAQRKAEAYKKQVEAKAATDRKKREEEYANKQEAAEQGRVSIGSTSTVKNPVKEPAIKKASTKPKAEIGKNLVFYTSSYMESSIATYHSPGDGTHNYFLNANGDTILKSKEFLNVFAVSKDNPNNPNQFPPNVGIVMFNKTKNIRGVNYYVEDLVNEKGERHFNDDNITMILHLVDDYFVVCYGKASVHNKTLRVGKAVIYNIRTRESVPIIEQRNYGQSSINYIMNVSYSVGDDYMWKKDTYKGFVIAEAGYKFSRIYYVTLDGKIEQQDIRY